jgi:hypothetical protein
MFGWLREVFDEKSPISSMRIMSMMSLVLAGWIAVRGLETHADLSGLTMLCGAFLSAAFGGKVFQKSIEIKAQNNSVTDISQLTKLPQSDPRSQQ